MRNLFMKLIEALRNSTGITDTNVTLERRAEAAEERAERLAAVQTQAAEDRAARFEYVEAQVRARTVRTQQTQHPHHIQRNMTPFRKGEDR